MMMVEWLVYALVVAALASGAAWLGERGARAQLWPVRWVWSGAMAFSVLVPLAVWIVPPSAVPAAVAPSPGAYVIGSLPPLTLAAAEPTGPGLDVILGWVWALVSVLLLATIAGVAFRLARRRRGWSPRVVDGVEVLVSKHTGPAAMGFLRGRVVLPEWALELTPEQRRLLVLHEAEHVRARDPQLALASLILCALAPWNLPLWWQRRRLRLAMELDCDARVLRRSGDRRGYGSLLLEVGQRRTRLALALAEPRSMLERRLRMITKDGAGKATARALALGAMATFLVVVACETPGPTGVAAPSARALDKTAVLVAADEAPCHPAMFVNGEATTRAGLEALAPEEIETIHVLKGAVALEVNRLRLVPESGEGAATLGSPECGVILIIAKDATAAERDRVRRMLEAASSERPEPEARSPEELSAAPTFTPMTVRPELLNGPEVKEALQQYYPPLLKDAGIGGTVNLWFFIDREGTVADTRVNKGSGHEALDQAALKVAERMRFTPAYDRDQRVPVWVALDVRFESEKVVDRADERAHESGLEAERERQLRERLDAAAERRRAEIREQAGRAERTADQSAEPTFTPMTEHPRLRNNREVSEWLMALYPPLLRDAGIGGTANVWFFIDEAGKVRKTAINRSSGYDAFDAAALKVAERMEFTPARNGDEVVAVWVALDVTFEVQ